MLSAPIVLLSLIDENRRLYRSFTGLPESWAAEHDLPPDYVFTPQDLDWQQPLALSDVRQDPRFRDYSIVAAGEAISYLGVPIVGTDGERLGSFSVFDTRVRKWCAEDVETLGDLAALARSELQLRVELAERRRAEEEMHQQKEILQKIFDHIPVMILFFDQSGRLRLVNRYWEQTLGLTLEESQTSDILSELLPDPEMERRVRHFIASPSSTWSEFPIRLRDGSVIETSWIHIPLSDGTSIGLGLSVAERRRLEDQLRQAQKMEAVGRLAGGVAHDFNNMLTIILGQCDLAAWTLSPDDPMHDRMREIRKAGERAAALTKQLLIFSRKQVITPQLVELNTIIEGVDRMLRRVLGEDIELTTILGDSLWPIFIDPGQMEQVLMNLVVNSRDAMPQGGRLTIETQNIELDAAYCRAHHDLTPGPYAMLTVSDTGMGMNAATCARIFEPFFTTKGEGKGTGLGLATVYGIVKQARGHIEVDSAPGAGTIFRIYLPRAARSSAATEIEGLRPRPKGGNETILLVEDNELVRELAAAVLRQYGYTVFEASNGDEALALCAQEGPRINLLVTDVVMPVMSGRQLAEQMTRLQTRLKVLYLSGYTDDSILRHGVLESEVAFLQKPFTPEALASKVREVLDSTARKSQGQR